MGLLLSNTKNSSPISFLYLSVVQSIAPSRRGTLRANMCPSVQSAFLTLPGQSQQFLALFLYFDI